MQVLQGSVVLLFPLLLAAATSSLAAQAAAPARVPYSGRVLDHEQKPVANATVTLVATGERGGLDAGDVVHVESDGEGRFRALLQPARGCKAWATAERGGKSRVSASVAVGMTPIELVLGKDAVATTFRVTDLAEWQPLGPLRVRVSLFDCAALTFEAELDADGALTLPALPNESCHVIVFCAGKVVHSDDTGVRGPLQLPPPRRLPVRVTGEQDQPIAGALVQRILMRYAQHDAPFVSRPLAYRATVATTAADGSAEVLLASKRDPLQGGDYQMQLFVASHEGCSESMSGCVQKPFANGEPVKDPATLQGVLPFKLRKQDDLVVKVLAPDGRLPQTVQWIGHILVPYDGESRTTVLDGGQLPVVDGAIRFPRPPEAERVFEIPDRLPPLAAGDPWQRLARPMTLVVPVANVQKAGVLDLRAVQALRLQVLDATAGPAIGAYVLCAPKHDKEFLDPSFATQARTDRSGRAVLPVLPGEHFVIVVHDNTWAQVVIDAQPGLAAQTLRLQPLACMRVRVADGEGKPLADVRFDSNGASWGGASSPADQLLNQLAWQVSSWALRTAVTDAEGRANLFFLDMKGMQMRLRAMGKGKQSPQLRLAATDEPLDITLR